MSRVMAGWGGITLDKVVREDLSEEVTFEQRPE